MPPSDATEHHRPASPPVVEEVEEVEEVAEAAEVEVEVEVEEVHQLQPLKVLYPLQTMLKQWEVSLKSSLETDSKPTTSSKESKDTSA